MLRSLLFSITLTLAATSASGSPPPDRRLAHYAGEWIGTGPMGMHCQLALTDDGHGVLIVDLGSGDLRAALLDWRNDNQSFRISAVRPVSADARQRIVPLTAVTVSGEFNDAFALNLPGLSGRQVSCAMQRGTAFDQHRSAARELARALGHRKP